MAPKRKPSRRNLQNTIDRNDLITRENTDDSSQIRKKPCRSSPYSSKTTGSFIQRLEQPKTVSKKRKSDTSDIDTIQRSPSKRFKQASHHFEDCPSIQASSIHIENWRVGKTQPKDLFTMDPTTRNNPKISMLAKSRPLSRKRSVGGSTLSSAVSDGGSQDGRNDEYNSSRYVVLLETHGCFMNEDQDDPVKPREQDVAMISTLLDHRPPLPLRSRFDDDIFRETLANLYNQNEAKIVRDIGELIFPSPQYLYSRGDIDMKELIDLVDEKWVQAIAITTTKPQPDVSVGFKRKAFSGEQLSKLGPYIGQSGTELSLFAACITMLFPFASCEAKRSEAVLGVADRQNAHSMFIAVRAIVSLYKLAGRDTQELHEQILAFSVSYHDKEVRIHGYFPRIDGDRVAYHRHEIAVILLKAHNGKEKWTAYRFVASIYQLWAPSHLERIRAVIDELPLNTSKSVEGESTGATQQMAASTVSDNTISGADEGDLEYATLGPDSLRSGTSGTSFSDANTNTKQTASGKGRRVGSSNATQIIKSKNKEIRRDSSQGSMVE